MVANTPSPLASAIEELTTAKGADGASLTFDERIDRFAGLVAENRILTMAPLLPLILNLKGKPYSLEDYAVFEDLFRFQMAAESVFMTGRQVAKTTSTAAEGVVKTNSIPNITSLYITPLFEQIRRFSTMFVQPFIDQSPVKKLWADTTSVQSVLHRSFTNHSKMVFSFALLNADRVRGISADMVSIDEIQDMNREHLPIIEETLSASQWAVTRFTGTPKTLDNTLTGLWKRSSQAEWFVPCLNAGCTQNGKPTWNIPSRDHHLDKMVGPWFDKFSERRPATVCYRCGRPISPRFGMWRHRYPKRRWKCAGYHIPQIIMPLHYRDSDKWSRLLAKREGWGNTPINVFYNEVMGEPYDSGAKLVSETELLAISNGGPLDPHAALRKRSQFRSLVMGVDWGGGGEKGVSFTVISVVGMKWNGDLEVIWGKRLLTPHDHIAEAREVHHWWNFFRPNLLAHDYTGAGALRETFLVQAGLRPHQLMPCMMVGAARNAPCFHVAPTPQHPRDHYRVDKSRTLLTTCAMIRLKRLKFFNWDYESDENRGLIYDFLSLIEEKTKTMAAGELYRIDRVEDGTDDFAQATNLACTGIWYTQRAWPNIAAIAEKAATEAQIQAAADTWDNPNRPGSEGDIAL